MTRVIGIDPGLRGGIACVSFEGNGKLALDWCVPMPTMDGPKGKRQIDACGFIDTVGRTCVGQWFIEHQHAMPLQGVTSTFQTGYGYGLLRGVLAAYADSVNVVGARTWQGALLPRVGDSKKESAQYAMALFPEHKWTATPRSKKPHDGMTDACCIAVYGAMAMRGDTK